MLFDSLCAVCRANAGPICGRCIAGFAGAGLRDLDGLDLAGVDSCRAAFVLDDNMRTAVAALKYRRQRRIAKVLAEHAVALVPQGADAITWVPATPKNRRRRGYDQAQALAQALSKSTGVPLVRLLRRSARDERQTGKSRSERLAGPALAAVRRSPAFVVIVDDVITTGSSIRTAARVLRGAGASRTNGVAVATTPAREARLTRLPK